MTPASALLALLAFLAFLAIVVATTLTSLLLPAGLLLRLARTK